jgi:two-component sensor histidine kinase
MEWREEGAPVVNADPEAGFGSTVVTGVLASQLDGSAEMDYRPEGLLWTIRCRASKVSAGAHLVTYEGAEPQVGANGV